MRGNANRPERAFLDPAVPDNQAGLRPITLPPSGGSWSAHYYRQDRNLGREWWGDCPQPRLNGCTGTFSYPLRAASACGLGKPLNGYQDHQNCDGRVEGKCFSDPRMAGHFDCPLCLSFTRWGFGSAGVLWVLWLLRCLHHTAKLFHSSIACFLGSECLKNNHCNQPLRCLQIISAAVPGDRILRFSPFPSARLRLVAVHSLWHDSCYVVDEGDQPSGPSPAVPA